MLVRGKVGAKGCSAFLVCARCSNNYSHSAEFIVFCCRLLSHVKKDLTLISVEHSLYQ